MTQLSPEQAAEEAVLLAQLRSGEQAACELLVRRYSPRMLAVAQRFMRCDADARDALQDAFMNVFKHLDQFQSGSRLGTWLHSVVVRACLMRLRTQRRKREEPIEDLLPRFHAGEGHRVHPGPEWTSEPEQMAQREEVRATVRRCIDELPESYRQVLLLRDIEELDTREVAELLGVSDGVVKTRLHRARQALRELLDPYVCGGAA